MTRGGWVHDNYRIETLRGGKMVDGVQVYVKHPDVQRMKMRRKRTQTISAWVLAWVLILTGWGLAFSCLFGGFGSKQVSSQCLQQGNHP